MSNNICSDCGADVSALSNHEHVNIHREITKDNTIDSEVGKLLDKAFSKTDADESVYPVLIPAITNLIAQEANKARLIELDLLEQAIQQGRDVYEFKMARLKDLESRLTAEKGSNNG